MKIEQISTNSLIIYFGDKISDSTFKKVQNSYYCIKNLNSDCIIDIVPSYTSIFLTYDIFKYSFEELKKILLDKINFSNDVDLVDEVIEVDVYYGLEVGLDLEYISRRTQLSIDEIIAIHSQKIYSVYAIGFLPGFGFLASVDKKIAIPRLSHPRKKVLKGSVGIADTQTAIYPQDSAGGWNIIGKTAKNLFDKSLDTLSPLSIGKKVKFNPISKIEFLNQGGEL